MTDSHTSSKCRGSAHESIVPYQAFECKDGMYMVGAGNDTQFAKLAAAIGRPELSEDPRFCTNRDRTQHRKVLVDLLQTTFMTMTRAELGAIFEVRVVEEEWLCRYIGVSRFLILPPPPPFPPQNHRPLVDCPVAP